MLVLELLHGYVYTIRLFVRSQNRQIKKTGSFGHLGYFVELNLALVKPNQLVGVVLDQVLVSHHAEQIVHLHHKFQITLRVLPQLQYLHLRRIHRNFSFFIHTFAVIPQVLLDLLQIRVSILGF